jgi:hypothetical protein
VPARLGDLVEAAASLGDGPVLLVVGEVYRDIVAAAERQAAPLRRTA